MIYTLSHCCQQYFAELGSKRTSVILRMNSCQHLHLRFTINITYRLKKCLLPKFFLCNYKKEKMYEFVTGLGVSSSVSYSAANMTANQPMLTRRGNRNVNDQNFHPHSRLYSRGERWICPVSLAAVPEFINIDDPARGLKKKKRRKVKKVKGPISPLL